LLASPGTTQTVPPLQSAALQSPVVQLLAAQLPPPNCLLQQPDQHSALASQPRQ
jgi:hypothetical protein